MSEKSPSGATLRQVRILLWLLLAIAVAGVAALVFFPRAHVEKTDPNQVSMKSSFGGPFTLVGGDGKPFSSQALTGKPYAMYFGFTRCGDVCPTTLSRLVKLRREAANDQALQIVFVTIDPRNDGPKEVGQYATLFNAPIVGLTGTEAQIDQVKKQYGIYAEPVPHARMGQEMAHTSTVLLFDRSGQFAGTISPDEPDSDALAKMKKLVA